MRISLALGPRQPLSRQTAWGCFTTNLAMPGFGSLMAGRFSGYPQAVLALGGLGMSVVFGARFVYWCLSNWTRLHGEQADPFGGITELLLAGRWAFMGIALFGAGWLWALATSSLILRAAKEADAPHVPPRLG